MQVQSATRNPHPSQILKSFNFTSVSSLLCFHFPILAHEQILSSPFSTFINIHHPIPPFASQASLTLNPSLTHLSLPLQDPRTSIPMFMSKYQLTANFAANRFSIGVFLPCPPSPSAHNHVVSSHSSCLAAAPAPAASITSLTLARLLIRCACNCICRRCRGWEDAKGSPRRRGRAGLHHCHGLPPSQYVRCRSGQHLKTLLLLHHLLPLLA